MSVFESENNSSPVSTFTVVVSPNIDAVERTKNARKNRCNKEVPYAYNRFISLFDKRFNFAGHGATNQHG